MTRRIGFSDIAKAVSVRAYCRLAKDFGGPVRALRLRTPRVIPKFVAYPKNIDRGISLDGLKILDGRFILGSQSLDVGAQGNPWGVSSPSEAFARKLHSFRWLNNLASVRLDTKLLRKKPKTSEQTQRHAAHLVDSWIETFGNWNSYAWESDILTHRVFSWLANWQMLLNADEESEAGALRRASLYRQIKRIQTTYNQTPSGVLKLRAAACLVLAGACFSGKQDAFLAKGLDLLEDEIDNQIFPDGGHISRSPEQLVQIYEILILTESALESRGGEISREIRSAIERITPMLLFFSTKDGALFSFNGGGEYYPKRLKNLIKLSKHKARPFGYAPHMKYQRLSRNGTIIMIDVGSSPERPYDTDAHLGPLAFEMSTDAGKMIVNCGWNRDQPQHWRETMRQTAAHSTLVLEGQSAGRICNAGMASKFLGAVIQTAVGSVQCKRKEQDTGTWLEAQHNSFTSEYGLSHMRRIYMDLLGADIRGEDTLFVPLGGVPITNKLLSYEVRFHLHPKVKVTLSQDQKSALLIQPGGHGWQFRTDVGPLVIEPSVYLADGIRPRKSEQIVISGQAYGDGDGQTRPNRIRWSLKRLAGVNASELV